MEAIKRNDVPMPQDMEGGKDKIVFGNILQIYEWHKATFQPELEKCVTEHSGYIGALFTKYENRFQMYVKYCENKPKSEYIVSEHDSYFDELRLKLNQKLNIQDLLIKPVQRIMKYQLMLKEIRKYMEKESKDCTTINRAIDIMITVPKNADDMMNVGRLQGFEGRITAQGRLLLQDSLLVQEPDDLATWSSSSASNSSSNSIGVLNAKKSKEKQQEKSNKELKERKVFLFQQIIIFSEMIGSASKKFTSPRYIYKCDMKVNKLQLKKDDSQLQFTLLDKTPESNKKILCQCEDQTKYNNWIAHLQDLLDMQNRFLRDLQHPQLAMQKNSGGGGFSPSSPGHIIGSSTSSTPGAAASQHSALSPSQSAGPTSSSSESKHSKKGKDNHESIASQFNDFLKSTFSFGGGGNSNSSSQSSTSNSNRSSSNAQSVSPTNNNNINNTNSSKPKINSNSNQSAPSLTSLNNNNNNQAAQMVDSLNSDFAQSLTLKNNNNGSSSSSAVPSCARVVNSYAAITEDEITLQKGDLVQIITANMHNRFLVHREASEQQPAAEGWIPGHVIGFQNSNS
jgi:triple functional domain protein